MAQRRTFNTGNRQRSQRMRKNMTLWERRLWFEFLSTYPVRFRRQRLIGNYIVDFYCAKAELVIELDGGGHFRYDVREQDNDRTHILEARGLHILRFANNDVDRNFEGVCAVIDTLVQQRIRSRKG
ncbi:endonuclease domain-containing protein [Bifidobacterium callimiconis]|nr:endonuclease domain-containing protein [Bifidobacterium callimiconis]